MRYSAKLDAAPATATVLTIKMVSVDADNDDTYTAGNTSGVPTNPNEAPIMTLALLEAYPTDAQGLGGGHKSGIKRGSFELNIIIILPG